MAILYNRREEVRALLRAAARTIAARERGEDVQLSRIRITKLDAEGQPIPYAKVISTWATVGPIEFDLKDVDPELIRLITGEEVTDNV